MEQCELILSPDLPAPARLLFQFLKPKTGDPAPKEEMVELEKSNEVSVK